MLHTVLAWSLPNGHAGKQMLFLQTMASETPASNFPATMVAHAILQMPFVSPDAVRFQR
jgi:hypothetical protein